ncbi:Fur family transcriptional regulator [Millisia brevis]|uniref:Fur family transcriptional regulator n=1 Tax=Millisia brevis TaxID=264148 RepID=UPI00082BC632|nr:Fur family transcriptional regulator [Millisia brevis]
MSEGNGLPGRARRSTKQRAAIVGLLEEIDEFRSAQDLHEKLRSRGEGIGLTTVYRALQALADEHAVDVVRTDSGESMYRRCSTGHHHHLLCRECGKAIEVAGPAVERWAAAIAAEHDFTDVTHTIEIFGTCADCR